MLPIWLLYFFPHSMGINYMAQLALADDAGWIAVECMRGSGVCVSDVSRTAAILKGWGFGILSELVGIGFFCVTQIHLNVEFYDTHYRQFSIAALLLAALLNVLLHARFTFRKLNITKVQRITAAVLMTAAVLPYLFLLPQ